MAVKKEAAPKTDKDTAKTKKTAAASGKKTPKKTTAASAGKTATGAKKSSARGTSAAPKKASARSGSSKAAARNTQQYEGKTLVVVESPAKARTLEKILGSRYKVLASIGHVRDLPKGRLAIDVDNGFEPEYIQVRGKADLIRELKAASGVSKTTLLASDPDREGEAIAWHLSKILEKESAGKPIYRIVFNEITQKAIQGAIEKPGEIDMKKVDAQQARRVLDRVVGYSISPILWRVIAKDLSAGRVQSVALRLICEREAEILAFEAKEYWRIEANFWKDNLGKFKATLERYGGKKLEINDE